MPTVISVFVTPRVCAAADALTTSTTANIVNLNFMVASSLTVTQNWLGAALPRACPLLEKLVSTIGSTRGQLSGHALGGVSVHALDQLLVLLFHKLTLQLHCRR